MLRAFGVRAASLVGVLLALLLLVFVVQHVLPADPALALIGPRAGPELLEAKRNELGLSESLPSQYWIFFKSVLRGNFGESLTTGRPVSKDIAEYAPATIELAVTAFVFSVLLGLLFGLLSAARLRGGRPLRLIVVVFSSVPPYFVALLGLVVLANAVNWIPVGGRISREFRNVDGPTGFLLADTLLAGSPRGFLDAAGHLVLPSIALALVPAAAIGRSLRAALVDEWRSEYVATARALGARTPALLLRHALPNSVRPVLSIAGLQFGALLTGTIVVEGIFNWPGLGRYGQIALKSLDMPAIIGLTLFGGTLYVLINTVVELLQIPLDPSRMDWPRSLRAREAGFRG